MTEHTISYVMSEIGRVRETNEDFCFASDTLGLFVLADGMGGLQRGEVASRLAVETVVDFVSPRIAKLSDKEIEKLASESVLRAHFAVTLANQAVDNVDAMGTTLSVLLVAGRHFTMASIGDSRCFWLHSSERGRHITQITRDDTVAASLILRGVPPELIRAKENHTLTQAIGLSPEISPHVASGALERGDMIVMCTDGVTDYLPQADFQSAMLSLARSPRTLAEALVAGALNGGGGDNCSCICILASLA